MNINELGSCIRSKRLSIVGKRLNHSSINNNCPAL